MAGLRPFIALTLAACTNAAAPRTDPTPADPAQAQLVTSDLANFWAAYDAGGKDGNASTFQSQYLDKASRGLKDFIQRRALTAQSLAQMVTAYPDYFAAVRANTLGLATTNAVTDEIRGNFVQIEALYPAAVFPPVTFLIGRFSTGGTVGESGMLIGTEFYRISSESWSPGATSTSRRTSTASLTNPSCGPSSRRQ